MSLKVIDDASLRVLQDAVKLINQRPPYSPTRPPFNPDSPSLDTNSTPEVYVCRVPEGGLPALSLAEVLDSVGTSTGTDMGGGGDFGDSLYQVHGAYCAVYQVENIDGVLREVPGNTPYVYNLSSEIIPEDTWILVARDNYGDWFAVGTFSSPNNDVGTGTGTHEHIGGTPCDNLALIDQYDCLLISTTDPCGNPFETYLRYSGGHWTSTDEFCYIGGSGTFDFYYLDGRFHLELDDKELIDCGTGCFTGSWITGHWAQPGDGVLGTGTSSGTEGPTVCSGPSFTICLECSCCVIDNWQGPGYYCIVIPDSTGTGTISDNCEPVLLEDSDKCSDIIICSGKYDTVEEVLAACSMTTGTGTGAIPVIGGANCTSAVNLALNTTYSWGTTGIGGSGLFTVPTVPTNTYRFVFTGDPANFFGYDLFGCGVSEINWYSAAINNPLPVCVDHLTNAFVILFAFGSGVFFTNITFRVEQASC